MRLAGEGGLQRTLSRLGVGPRQWALFPRRWRCLVFPIRRDSSSALSPSRRASSAWRSSADAAHRRCSHRPLNDWVGNWPPPTGVGDPSISPVSPAPSRQDRNEGTPSGSRRVSGSGARLPRKLGRSLGAYHGLEQAKAVFSATSASPARHAAEPRREADRGAKQNLGSSKSRREAKSRMNEGESLLRWHSSCRWPSRTSSRRDPRGVRGTPSSTLWVGAGSRRPIVTRHALDRRARHGARYPAPFAKHPQTVRALV